MATKKKVQQQSKAAKDKAARQAKGERAEAKALAQAKALKKVLEAKEAAGLKKMARSSRPSGLVSVERKGGGLPGSDKMQRVLSYLRKDSGNLDFIYSLIIRLK
jgi:hypothetical protein